MANVFLSWIFFIVFYGSLVMAIEDDRMAHFPTAWAADINPLCYNDSQLYLKAYSDRDQWASKSIIAIVFFLFGKKKGFLFVLSVQIDGDVIFRRIEEHCRLYSLRRPV